jgi:nickel-dependent lactate racemase
LAEIARLAGVDFIVNVVIDEERALCGVYSGDVEAAHLEGIRFAMRYDIINAAEHADIVITSSAGYPLDKTYYQTIKGMVGALNVVKKGGTIIIASECGEGLGNDTFVECLRKFGEIGDIDKFIEYIDAPENFIADQWQVEKMAIAMRRAEIILVTEGLSPEREPLTQVRVMRTLDAALKVAFERQGVAARVAVIPEGPYVIPCRDACGGIIGAPC